MRDMRAMMFTIVLIRLVCSHDEGGNVVFPAVGKDEAGIIICSFHTVGIAVGRAGLVSYYGFGWQHTFQFVGTGFSIYHGLPQEVFQLLVGEQLFFISRSQ